MVNPKGARAWADLSETERTRLLVEYQATLDREPKTCEIDIKLARMQAWLEARGVVLEAADLRRPART